MQVRPPHRVAAELEERIRPLETDLHRAYWESQIAATPENERRRAECELQLRRVKGDAAALKAIEESLAQELHDELLTRRLQILRLMLVPNQMDEGRRRQIVELSSAVENDFAAYRPSIDGRPVTDNDIESILRTSDDSDLRARAWGASKEIGGVVANRVRELARLRNAAALDQGFADYYSMSLELQEQPEEWLFELLAQVEELTNEPFRKFKQQLDSHLRTRFAIDDLYPWHYADPFFQQLPPDGRVSLEPFLTEVDPAELSARTFMGWEIDLGGVMASSDLYPRQGKCQHAFCLDIDRSTKDVRILANIVPGERWTEVMLHESGHAAYDVCIDAHLPYSLRRAAHTFVTEAVAILSGRLIRDTRWLVEIAGLDAGVVAGIEPELRRASAAQMLLFARWALVVVHFERELYRDPESDLDAYWWELVERFQMIPPPPDRVAPDWAAKIHVVTAPAYYQNYVLGEMLASQLKHALERESGGLVGVPEAGQQLRDKVLTSGASLRWDAVVSNATGRELSAEGFVTDIAPAV
jgi:peptidyl-dipeptidase A